MTTTEILNILNQKKDLSFQAIFEEMPDLTFPILLDTYCVQKQIKKSELIKKTNLDRTYAYKIMNGFRVPSQDKVIQFALALHLDVHDTNLLLTLSNNKSLYPKIKRDALIIYSLNHQLSVIQTNELLDEYHFHILE